MIRRLSDRFWNYLTDRIEARMHLRPDRDDTLDLGSSDYQWRRVYVGPGSAAAPAITLDGDTDTGIYRSAADNLDITTGGVQRLNISSTGLAVVGKVLGSTPVGAQVYNNANITIPSGSYTALTFNSERLDTDNIHSTVTNTSRLTAQRSGWYLLNANVSFAYNATGIRVVRFLRNGETVVSSTADSPSANPLVLTKTAWLNQGDYVELQVYQNSGGDLDVQYLPEYSPEFSMARIA